MNEIFSWWTGSNLQIAIVLFCVLCALGTLVSLALCSDTRSKAEQDHDDEQQAKAVRRVSSANYWEQA
jgi:hypothetical protein